MSLSNIFDLPFPEQKKEGERFFYEVCDSKHLILYLAVSPKPKDHCTSDLFSFACLDQADSEMLAVHLPPAVATDFHEPPRASRDLGTGVGAKREGHGVGIVPHPHPLPKTTPRAARM